MRCLSARRLTAAFIAIWLTVVVGGRERMHRCPTDAAATAPSHAHMAHGDAKQGADGERDEHRCSCVGDCCASALVALASDAAPRFPTPAAPGAGFPSLVATAGARDRAHVLPFANGPPRA